MSNQASYLRVSLLCQCNLACSYCSPGNAETKPVKRTPPEKFEQAIRVLHQTGIRKVRFTGGEPTLYKGLPRLVAYVKSLSNNMKTAITTNGLLLERLAKPLAEAGLDSVNISLDTLSRDRYQKITGTDALQQAVTGIHAAIKHLPEVKLNCVVMAGINSDETEAMIRRANSWGIDVRFIEFMPTKQAGSRNSLFVSGNSLRASLPFELTAINTQGSSAARYYRSDLFIIKVGFIDPVSHSFCALCDRIRLASDGRLYGCLYSGTNFNLFEALGDGESDTLEKIGRLVATKEFAGCAAGGTGSGNLPSFINIGG